MSTPTPIEIVRAYLDARVTQPGTEADLDLDCAIGSVLRDAERFQALERAHEQSPTQAWSRLHEDINEWAIEFEPLAEIADRLKEAK